MGWGEPAGPSNSREDYRLPLRSRCVATGARGGFPPIFANHIDLPILLIRTHAQEDVLVLNVHSNRKTLSHSFFSRIFSTLDRHHVAVDLISTSEVHVSMAISAASLRRPSRTLDLVCSELGPVGTVSVLRDMAILSLVGRQMRHMVGVAGKMFATLAEGGINIEMISQGANEINISCCIHAKSALKALNLIHYSVLEVGGPAGVGVKPVGMESGNFGRSFV